MADGSRCQFTGPWWGKMFAFVRFLDDNVCYALPAACVQGFRPRSRADFDSQRVYDVYRGPEVGESRGEHRRAQGLQRAQILALADDKMDLENRVIQKKIKIPKLSVSDSFDDSGDHYEEDEVELRHSKRLEGRKMTESAHKSLEAVVARLEKQNGMTWSHSSSEEGFMDSSEPIHIDCVDSTAVPRSLYEELLRSYQQQQQQMRHIQQELERTRRQLVQQAKKLKEYGCLVSEVKELRDLNRRLQDVLLLRLGSVSASDQALRGMDSQDDVDSSLEDRVNPWRRHEVKSDVCTQQVIWRHSSSPAAMITDSSDGPPIKVEKVKTEIIEPEPDLPKTISEEANTSSYYPVPVMDKYILENGKNPCPDLAAKPPSSRHLPQVHLGSGIWVDEEKWHQLQVTQGDSKFTKNLAVMIWGTDVLKNRSVTGVATKKKKDAIPKPPLSPHKLSLVRECLYDRIAQETVDETEIAQRLSKVNKYICEKIMDINKSCKNEERREAKFHRK